MGCPQQGDGEAKSGPRAGEALKAEGLTGEAILRTFLARRIQPIRARDHTMWLYSSPDYPTRESPLELTEAELSRRVQDITEAGGLEGVGPQPPPLSAD